VGAPSDTVCCVTGLNIVHSVLPIAATLRFWPEAAAAIHISAANGAIGVSGFSAHPRIIRLLSLKDYVRPVYTVLVFQ
jgi:hypothetical protein